MKMKSYVCKVEVENCLTNTEFYSPVGMGKEMLWLRKRRNILCFYNIIPGLISDNCSGTLSPNACLTSRTTRRDTTKRKLCTSMSSLT